MTARFVPPTSSQISSHNTDKRYPFIHNQPSVRGMATVPFKKKPIQGLVFLTWVYLTLLISLNKYHILLQIDSVDSPITQMSVSKAVSDI